MLTSTRSETIFAFLLVLVALTLVACGDTSDATFIPVSVQEKEIKEVLEVARLEVSSQNFQEKARPRKRIPQKNSCLGEDISPPLEWSNIPQGTKSLALIVDEPEDRVTSHNKGFYTSSASGNATHWVLYNIPIASTGLPEAVPTTTDVLPDGTKQGLNDFGVVGYSGPCPPPSLTTLGTHWYNPKGTFSSDPPHDYYFRLYALDEKVNLSSGATAAELKLVMERHIIGYGETMGKFQVPRTQVWFQTATPTP